jgi:4-aminobutyrate aminotransferase-like enzyme
MTQTITQTPSTTAQSDAVPKHKEYLFPAVTMYYKEPIALERGQGEYVWDDQGNRYLDCFGGVLTVSVGHNNPKVTEAVVEQVKKLAHTSTLYATQPTSDLAEKLAQISPGKLKKTFFTNSGTEANDTAIAAARAATGRKALVVLRHSYHGRSATTLSAGGHATWKRPSPDLQPGFVHAHAPYCYRCPFHAPGPHACGLECAEDIDELIQTTTTGEIAAFMAETILGVGGFIVPPPGYFEKAVGIARKYGGLFIADEVQAAWGRTGGKWFGIEHWDVKPDILVSAKGMGNGAPIAMTIATPEVADKYPGITFATFGGNPVSMAAGLSTIQYIEDNNLLQNCKVVGEYLGQKLAGLKEKHQIVGDARGMGLMQGVELVKDRKTKQPNPEAALVIMEETKKRKVLVGKGGLYGNVIRTGMMLNSTKAHVDEMVAALDAGLTAAAAA